MQLPMQTWSTVIPFRSADFADVAGAVWCCGEGFEGGEVEVDYFVVDCVLVGCELDPVFLSALGVEEGFGDVVAGEDAGGDAAFRAHVGDGCAVGDGEGLDAGAGVFEDAADVAFDGEDVRGL